MRAKFFIPITKVDVDKRMVYGVAADETPDRQGEIWDYEGNKPLWQGWSDTAKKNTEGKSLGNVRAMHGAVAAGKLVQFDLDDATKSMAVCAHIVDDNEWEKAKEGVYSGFSVGGNYVKRWADKTIKGIKRVIIEPFEISLADLPANPSATFEAVKTGGECETRAFSWAAKMAEREDVNPEEGKRKYGAGPFADEKNKKYPIDTEEHIRAAWNYIHKKKNRAKYSPKDADAIEARIVAAWKDKIDKAGPPSAKTLEGDAAKGLWTVGNMAALLEALASLHRQVVQEAEMENDGSDVPDQLAEAIGVVADVFMEMSEEEIDEMLTGISGSPAQQAA